jgi:hypothetical protein
VQLAREARERPLRAYPPIAGWRAHLIIDQSLPRSDAPASDGNAITVIATLVGALGSFLQKRGQEIDDKR